MHRQAWQGALHETAKKPGLFVTGRMPVPAKTGARDEIFLLRTSRNDPRDGQFLAPLPGDCPDGIILPLKVRGFVMHGDKRGRLIGFPAANSDLPEDSIQLGVQSSLTSITGHAGVSVKGARPTFQGCGARLETHIIDFDRYIYGLEDRGAAS